MRKPGGSKLVYDKKKKAIRKVKINRFKRFVWWIKQLKRVKKRGKQQEEVKK